MKNFWETRPFFLLPKNLLETGSLAHDPVRCEARSLQALYMDKWFPSTYEANEPNTPRLTN